MEECGRFSRERTSGREREPQHFRLRLGLRAARSPRSRPGSTRFPASPRRSIKLTRRHLSCSHFLLTYATSQRNSRGDPCPPPQRSSERAGPPHLPAFRPAVFPTSLHLHLHISRPRPSPSRSVAPSPISTASVASPNLRESALPQRCRPSPPRSLHPSPPRT